VVSDAAKFRGSLVVDDLLLPRSWFTRVWVIQEFIVSVESHFIEFYGGRSRVIPNVLANVMAAASVIDKSKPRNRRSADHLTILLGRGAWCFAMLMEQ
jgi:hypothetical protein